MSFNLRFGLAEDGPNNWSSRQRIVPYILGKYPADFIGFQEVNDFQGDILRSVLPNHGCIGNRKNAPPFWQNNIIFYEKSWQCVYHEHFFLSPTPAIPSRFPESRWPRQCTLGVFEKRTEHVICVNTHFDFEESVQIESAKIIMGKIMERPMDFPAFIMGDFNANPSSACHRIFMGNDALIGENDPVYFRNAFGDLPEGTFHGFTGKADGKAIDWILYRYPARMIKRQVIRDNLNGYYPSDHFPILADFQLS